MFVHRFTLMTVLLDMLLLLGMTLIYIDLVFGTDIVNGFAIFYKEGMLTPAQ